MTQTTQFDGNLVSLMPALITHHLFGENAVTLLPDGVVQDQEPLIAFLLGCQGPDPFFARFRTLPERAADCHELAWAMHATHMTRSLLALREGVSHVWDEDKEVARSFALGMLCHYVLDRTCHPFIYAQQYALVEGASGLEGAGIDVHAVIESDLDSWVLWEERHETVLEFKSDSVLASTERVDRVAGALLSQVALQMFDIEVGPEQYAGAVRDYRFAYRAVDPYGSARLRLFGRIERLFRPHSHLEAMAHRVVTTDTCPAANLERLPWRDPSTGEVSTESFADLYHDALHAWPSFAEALIRGDADQLARLVDSRNYNGEIVADD